MSMPAGVFAWLNTVKRDPSGLIVDQNVIMPNLVGRDFDTCLFVKFFRHLRPVLVFVLDLRHHDIDIADIDRVVLYGRTDGRSRPGHIFDRSLCAIRMLEVQRAL